ncbi:MAG: arylsulfatase [Ferruginibacter sp.]
MFKSFTVFFLLLAVTVNAQQKSKQPNIIFILADDLGYADLGCYGQQKTETPHLDRMAQEGMRFTQFYSGSTVCAPARTSFMTGLHTGHTPIRGNRTFEPEGQTPLAEGFATIANILQQHGYNTGAFGKWSLGFITTSGDPQKKGFDEFFGYNCQSLAHDYYPDHLWSNHQRIDFEANKTANVIYSADTIHAMALNFIKRQNNRKPFFMYLPYTLPHGDVILPHDSVYNYYIRKLNEAAIPFDRKKDSLAYEPHPHAAFAAMVSRLDRYTGEILKQLDKQGLLENTVVLFASDNGPHKENGGDPEFFQNHGIYRGIKRDLYEGGIRVPFIAYWKKKIKPGVTDQWATIWDMYPTFQALARINPGIEVDGESLLPTLLQKGIQPQPEYLYWEFHENNGRQALRWKNWKLIKLKVNNAAETITELYDLDSDPSEKNNQAPAKPYLVNKLEAMLKKAHTANKDWPLLPAEITIAKPAND